MTPQQDTDEAIQAAAQARAEIERQQREAAEEQAREAALDRSLEQRETRTAHGWKYEIVNLRRLAKHGLDTDRITVAMVPCWAMIDSMLSEYPTNFPPPIIPGLSISRAEPAAPKAAYIYSIDTPDEVFEGYIMTIRDWSRQNADRIADRDVKLFGTDAKAVYVRTINE